MRFTPGPWEVKRGGWDGQGGYLFGWKGISIVTFDEGLTIANILPVHPASQILDPGYNREAANASLIAAAPELLEACRRFVRDINAFGMEESVGNAEALGAAAIHALPIIARAEGTD